MTRKAENLLKKLDSAKYVHWTLHREIQSWGGGATGQMATMFMNASNDLMAINRKIKNAFANGDISKEEYLIITSRA